MVKSLFTQEHVVAKRLCAVADIPRAGVLGVDTDLGDLIVACVAGKIKAWHNVCPHAGRRLDWAAGKFLVEDGKLVCAAHGAMFDLASGTCVSGPARGAGLAPAAVTVTDAVVYFERDVEGH